ncbi:cupin domain-containing protein [Hymenobacter sp. 102]|uniref:cupin domain-containing protein n=1 Tax=Hymenobacter sp. 102 TaxID=3403152 RepID=UPI003CEF5A73
MHLYHSTATAPSTLHICSSRDFSASVQQRIHCALTQGISALEQTVGELLQHQRAGQGDCQTLGSIIAELSRPDSLRLLLSQLLCDGPALTRVQEHSYYHHNGFRKLVLLQNAAFKLRLHLWEARSERHHENIHDHRWNFASALLAGRFQTVIWEEDAQGPEVRLDCTYTPAREGSVYGVRENGRVRLRPQRTHTLQEGDIYYMPASTLHQVTDPGEGATRTLMLTATPVLEECKLYAEHSIPEADKINMPFSLSAIRQELIGLLGQTCYQPALAA